MGAAPHTRHVVAGLRLLCWRFALWASGGVLPYEIERCFFIFLCLCPFGIHVRAYSTIKEVAMPAVFAELAVRELAVSTNMKPARERFILSHRIGLILFVLDGWDINKVFFEFGTHFFRGCAWLWVLVPFCYPLAPFPRTPNGRPIRFRILLALEVDEALEHVMYDWNLRRVTRCDEMRLPCTANHDVI